MINNGVIDDKGPSISDNDRLSFAFFLAIAFHVILFIGIVFTIPDEQSPPLTPAMQVVMAQYHASAKPEKADFIGQDNQEGGGEKDLLQSPSTTEIAEIPDPNKQAAIAAMEIVADTRIQPTPEVMTGVGQEKVFLEQQIDAPKEDEQPLLDTATLLQKSYQLAGSTAPLDDRHQFASRNLRKRAASAAIHRASDAQYLNNWRRRIEEVGNKNYPAQAKKNKVYGDLTLKVAVNNNGTVRDISIIESSGHKILDDAAIRIVRDAAPFAPFDENLRKDTDVLEIVRLWQFQPGNVISTR